ncbi:MAG TPA: SprT family zinc-dependent metalloprotease [Candidatus Krumholzibacteria bacterium]|nr:SprT family zinc-dependent metalloprotease [Candidatus Krumholzibacteria bacterium]HPD70878.1 SprT family zinc-dependent metalloprotease [Candidatus Krumholzibacteria bacterium]HRY39422.1 SprT family zinc-dependent metalloprotease [Candidatus Krumholzibacteria bacterium]
MNELVRMVGGRPLRLSLRRSARARSVRVEVSVRGGVAVVVPRRATLRDVEELLAASEQWLAREADRHGVWDGPRRLAWATGSELAVLGRRLRLELAPLAEGRSRPRAAVRDTILRLELPPQEILDPRPAVERWLRRFAGVHLRTRTADLGDRLQLQPRRVLVGDRTSRWGSCSSRGTLSFCYRLVMAPPAVVDAVVIHELCHLAHGDHGPRWRALVRRHCPDHDAQMSWLREQGGALEL